MTAPSFDPASTRRAVLREVAQLLASAGVAEPQADAHILVEDATGLTRSGLLRDAEAPLGVGPARRLAASVKRRLAHEPVFRILGRREFWGLDIEITPDVLDPRPDTETVVWAALEGLDRRQRDPLRILDLGTGSGAILCALLSELPAARGIGVDRSAAACAVAARNVAACGLSDRATIRIGNWARGLAGPFDLVVSNPPYIETEVIAGLSAEVRDHDPLDALDGGRDGLDAYRAICPSLRGLLAPGGLVVFEVGARQAGHVAELLLALGFDKISAKQDLGGHQRAVMGALGA